MAARENGKSQLKQCRPEGPYLPEEDQQFLARYQRKLQLVRDRTAGVVLGYYTGFILHGPGGVSKSYTVMQSLEEMQANYRLSNSRLTGRGLFDNLRTYPDSIHLIEDAEQMLSDRHSVGVLRAALWGLCPRGDQGMQERWVTWSAHRANAEFPFTGGIILISNRPLLDQPELLALKTRVPCMHLQPSNNELRALMRQVALAGFRHDSRAMTVPECVEVCEFIITASLSLHRPLDMRLLINCFCDYLQWREGEAGVHWQDAVAARVRERPTAFQNPVLLGSVWHMACTLLLVNP
jgi:hypothetical protein